MASLKELRARAKKHGLVIYTIKNNPKYRYRFNHFYVRNIDDLSKGLSLQVRQDKAIEMGRKLNGHRPKYGYKTVPRKKRIMRGVAKRRRPEP